MDRRRAVDHHRGSARGLGGEDGLPRPDRPRRGQSSSARRRPRAASPRPPSARTPAGPTPGRSAASTHGSTDGRRTPPWPRTSASSTTRAGRRRARRRRWPRRASGPASPTSRPRPGNGRPGSSPATGGRPAVEDGGKRGRSGRRTWPPSLATCHRPRRRVRPGRPRARPPRRGESRGSSSWRGCGGAR